MARDKLRRSGRVYRNPTIISPTPRQTTAIYVPKWIIISLIVLGAVGGLVYIMLFSPTFSVTKVETRDDVPADVKQVLESYVGQNIFRINSSEINAKVRHTYPEVLEAKIYRGLPDILRVQITKRETKLIWRSGSKEYLVDENGIAFKEVDNETLPEEGGWPRLIDPHSMPVKIGSRVATIRFMVFVESFAKLCKEKANLDLTSWEIGETSIHATSLTKEGWRILVDTSRSASNQCDDLAAIIGKHRSDINEYIDLRVAGYAYYK